MQLFKSSLAVAACAAFGMLAVGTAQATVVKGGTQSAGVEVSPGMMLVPSGAGFAVQVPNNGAVHTGGNGINYHGGATLVNGPKVYYIWYGDGWASDTGTTILTDLMNSTGGSPHFNINTTYFQGKIKGTKVKNVKYIQNVVTLMGQTTVDSTSGSKWHGTTLNDPLIKTIVTEAISSGALPSDTGALYFVLTDKTVKETSGFCSQYCGWHANDSILGANIKYSFVGNAATQCPSGCISGNVRTKAPNDNAGADGMASVIMHELEEATTDPDVSGLAGLKYGWYDDASGGENGDKCAWTFGTLYTAPNGAKANVHLGARDYMIQQNWVNAGGGFCSMSH